MGSKQAILPVIMNALSEIKFDTVLDAFSGSGCVAYELKMAGKRVIANDMLQFAYHIANATIANSQVRMTSADIERLISPNPRADSFIRETFSDLYYSEQECAFLDNVYANIRELTCKPLISLALASLCRACMKKRPRGIFTFTGHKGWDGRRDLRITMEHQFAEAAKLFSGCVFDNGQVNLATCSDVFKVSPDGIDLVYIDTPYISIHSDCDYTRRYHFVEGLCVYWNGLEIQTHTSTKKIKSYPTAFKSVKTADSAFLRLFNHFKNSKLVVSYSSNNVPNRERMIELLKMFKRHVEVIDIPHKYCFGNQAHKVGDNNNEVTEFLFIAI